MQLKVLKDPLTKSLSFDVKSIECVESLIEDPDLDIGNTIKLTDECWIDVSLLQLPFLKSTLFDIIQPSDLLRKRLNRECFHSFEEVTLLAFTIDCLNKQIFPLLKIENKKGANKKTKTRTKNKENS